MPGEASTQRGESASRRNVVDAMARSACLTTRAITHAARAALTQTRRAHKKAEGCGSIKGGRSAGVTRVVAGALAADGRILVAKRKKAPHAGLWEFPGGKVEGGESDIDALRRELREELGVAVERAALVHTRDHDYAHGSVRIMFHVVLAWTGLPTGAEGQCIAWVPDARLHRVRGLQFSGGAQWLLPSNRPAVRFVCAASACARARHEPHGSPSRAG